MKKSPFLLLAGLLSFNVLNAQSKSIDMSAMDHVWKIIAKLENDTIPLEAEWNAMFDSPGYKALGDWNNENIRKNFELVFLPAKKQRLDSILKTGNYWRKRDLNHLIKVKAQKEEIKNYQLKIDVEKILEEALVRAELYLPKGISKKYPPPPLRFVIFSPDARSMNGSIIYDLQYAYSQSQNEFTNVIAHEVHHHYSFLMEKTQFSYPNENSSYEPIVSVISNLRSEGIADLIDKSYPPVIIHDDTIGYNLKINAQQQQAAKMKVLDSILSKLSDDTSGIFEMGKTALSLFPGNAHYNGQYMAVSIKKHLGIAPLVEASSNPFLFIKLYQQACKQEKSEYLLSDKAINCINKLEKMFYSR